MHGSVHLEGPDGGGCFPPPVGAIFRDAPQPQGSPETFLRVLVGSHPGALTRELGVTPHRVEVRCHCRERNVST